MISFDRDKCNGCNTCINVCPQRVIALKEQKAEMTDYPSCMECGACAMNCEQGAVTLTKGTGCLSAIIKEDILKIVPKGTGCGCGDTGESVDTGCC